MNERAYLSSADLASFTRDAVQSSARFTWMFGDPLIGAGGGIEIWPPKRPGLDGPAPDDELGCG